MPQRLRLRQKSPFPINEKKKKKKRKERNHNFLLQDSTRRSPPSQGFSRAGHVTRNCSSQCRPETGCLRITLGVMPNLAHTGCVRVGLISSHRERRSEVLLGKPWSLIKQKIWRGPSWINSFQVQARLRSSLPRDGVGRGVKAGVSTWPGSQPGETRATVPSCSSTGAKGHKSLKGGDHHESPRAGQHYVQRAGQSRAEETAGSSKPDRPQRHPGAIP